MVDMHGTCIASRIYQGLINKKRLPVLIAQHNCRFDDTVFVCGGEEAVRQFVARHGFP